MLNAGNYGVPQSRKRTFIWAAAPEELLPDWPQQQFVFRSPQLTINLPGGVTYTAVPQQQVRQRRAGAPQPQAVWWGRACSAGLKPVCTLGAAGPCLTPRPTLTTRFTPQGAPLRTVTVKDAIGDLPNIKNGHDM